MRLRSLCASVLWLAASCASQRPIAIVRAYREAHVRGDTDAERRYLSPAARIWYEQKTGDGDPLSAGKSGRYAHWDDFFHSRATLRDWSVSDNAVSATVSETNDFYELLEWKPSPYRMTWWVDRDGKIAGALVQSLPGKSNSRMAEFREWAQAHHPQELEYLMPGGKLDPTGDRAERFKAILIEWRSTLQ
jgi:hypothetical protein